MSSALLLWLLTAARLTGYSLSTVNTTLTSASSRQQVIHTLCSYHDQAQGDHQRYSDLVHCRGTNTCFAIVSVKLNATGGGPVVTVQNQGCWREEAEEKCHHSACLIDQSSAEGGASKRHFCCCKGRLCNKHIMDASVHQTTIAAHTKVHPPQLRTQQSQPVDRTASPLKVLCAYHHEGGPSGNSTVGTVMCHGSRKCFAAAVVTRVNASYHATVVSQGCWQDERSISCHPSACLVGNPPALTNGKVRPQFCCCYGDLCNNNITTMVQRTRAPSNDTLLLKVPSPSMPMTSDKKSIVLSAISSIFIVSVLAFVAMALWRYARMKKRQQRHGDILSTSVSRGCHGDDIKYDKCPQMSIDDLTYGDVIMHGQFSTVCKAVIGTRDVVVKIFPPQSKKLWANEKDIYTVLNCHPHVAKLIAASEIQNDAGIQRMLVLANYAQGTLSQYLECRTMTWCESLRLILSLANGIAFIHGEIDEYLLSERIVVVHRDINSKSILIKADGMCVLSDFGLAQQIVGRKGCPTSEVGTIHYLPPEMLSGAVNWHDWESALKQADIYSLSLVLWEICCRCKDLYHGTNNPIGRHMLPYEREVEERDLHLPTLEALKAIVVDQSVRPILPQHDGMPQAHQFLIDTIEECWDHEPEARLTALCVVRRIQHIATMTWAGNEGEDEDRSDNNGPAWAQSQCSSTYAVDLSQSPATRRCHEWLSSSDKLKQGRKCANNLCHSPARVSKDHDSVHSPSLSVEMLHISHAASAAQLTGSQGIVAKLCTTTGPMASLPNMV